MDGENQLNELTNNSEREDFEKFVKRLSTGTYDECRYNNFVRQLDCLYKFFEKSAH